MSAQLFVSIEQWTVNNEHYYPNNLNEKTEKIYQYSVDDEFSLIL